MNTAVTLTKHTVHCILLLSKKVIIYSSDSLTIQFGTQAKFRWSRDHNNQAAENAFSTPWFYSEMELEPVAG